MNGSAPHPNDAQTVKRAIDEAYFDKVRGKVALEAYAALDRLAACAERNNTLETAIAVAVENIEGDAYLYGISLLEVGAAIDAMVATKERLRSALAAVAPDAEHSKFPNIRATVRLAYKSSPTEILLEQNWGTFAVSDGDEIELLVLLNADGTPHMEFTQ